MNGLTLRLSPGGGGKSKKPIGYAPVTIPAALLENAGENNYQLQAFINSTSTDEQLTNLKKILDLSKDSVNTVAVKVMVATFFQAEAKHPIKSFISRHVTKNQHLQQPFIDGLASYISIHISAPQTDYMQYLDIVSKVALCIENFNAGAAAVRKVDIALAEYLKDCLQYCIKLLREKEALSPTEKNEIFNLVHLSLRLLLHIIQKANTDSMSKLTLMFEDIRLFIQDLTVDDDVPMDTKSVGGILYLTIHVIENGDDSWTCILNPHSTNSALSNLLCLEAARLSLFSAIATVVSAEHLVSHIVDDGPAIVTLTKKILDIGDRSSSESAFILGVARTLLQISKILEKVQDGTTGLTLVDVLLMFAWSHLEHYMDSVRHLTGQMLGCVVKYCAKMDRAGDISALERLMSAVQELDRTRKSFYVCVTCLAAEMGASALLQPDEASPTHPDEVSPPQPDEVSPPQPDEVSPPQPDEVSPPQPDEVSPPQPDEVSPPQPDAAARRPRLQLRLRDLLAALQLEPIQATVRCTLETLVCGCCGSWSVSQLARVWLPPVLELVRGAAPALPLAHAHALLVRACRLQPDLVTYIVPYIKEATGPSPREGDIKCILMLLRVARQAGASPTLWHGLVTSQLLQHAAVDAVDETRILALSLIVESPKSTELFTEEDLQLVLYYLKYNINAQAPNFRQFTLSIMKKFINRFEDSYKVIKREKQPNGMSDKVAYYLRFMECLRRQCFDSLLPGANYSRRFVALQLLAWCEHITLEGYEREWKPDYVEKLLLHLEDSYENNKAFALEVLGSCPIDMLKDNKYSISLDIEDIFRQASSLKPTDCVSASHKLDLLRRRLPDYILQNERCSVPEAVSLCLVRRLLSRLASRGLSAGGLAPGGLAATVTEPMYGLVHCLRNALRDIDPQAISAEEQWTRVISEVIDTCMAVTAAVAPVVNNSSPEGHLPMDMTPLVTDYGNTGNITLEDGRQVTAQMVLLCAWRAVKEVSLLLGDICSRLSISGEGQAAGTLSVEQVLLIGEHFTTLLAETKHRGAFEQAYVGFTKLLSRLWRCSSGRLHGVARGWLREVMLTLAGAGSGSAELCATRRSAGLPYCIQALVTTELEVEGNARNFHSCVAWLVRLARGTDGTARGTDGTARQHARHVLRALVRSAALHDSVAPHLADITTLALEGFENNSWAERNSSTLLFSALMVRMFGVQRSRAERLCLRNTMTGRIFFLRYPNLYDYMLEKLQEVNTNADSQELGPALYPVLLLLARLYPSSLEGTVSNLKLVAFIPHVLACASSSVLKTRQLAAKAIVPLISPEQYIPHIESMFKLIHQCNIKRNYCHGILLQLVRLLDARPPELVVQGCQLRGTVDGALWLLRQPCCLLADELLKLINLYVWRFPALPLETVTNICSSLHALIFDTEPSAISPGRDVCLSNAIYLYLVLATKYNLSNICDLVHRGLEHSSYEVVLSVLNYLLILHNNLEEEHCKFQEHLATIVDKSVINNVKNDNYIQLLCKVLKNKYLECQRKSLNILVLEGDTQRYIIETKFEQKVSDEIIIEKLLECIQSEHENLTHIYLQSLLNFVSDRLKQLNVGVLLDVIRVIFECSSSDHSENTRSVVVRFIEKNISELLELDRNVFNEADKFEVRATVWATIITLLEDDEDSVRQRVSDVVYVACGGNTLATVSRQHAADTEDTADTAGPDTHKASGYEMSVCRVCPARCAAVVREYWQQWPPAEGRPLCLLIALLDFNSMVVLTDDVSDECRVFDQNERYNIFLEETVWTNACADIIINYYKINDANLSVIDNPVYKRTYDRLCKDNIEVFKKMVSGQMLPRSDALNPKIELFVNRLRNHVN